MTILIILIFLTATFFGYTAGRFGDYYLNFWMKDPSWAPHHWIYGAILIIVGPLLFSGYLGSCLLFFGVGLFISDLKDFLDLKFAGSDNKNKSQRRFWHID